MSQLDRMRTRPKKAETTALFRPSARGAYIAFMVGIPSRTRLRDLERASQLEITRSRAPGVANDVLVRTLGSSQGAAAR